MSDKKLNCKNCEYKYCPFRGSDREISALFCEDYEPAAETIMGNRTEPPKEEA